MRFQSPRKYIFHILLALSMTFCSALFAGNDDTAHGDPVYKPRSAMPPRAELSGIDLGATQEQPHGWRGDLQGDPGLRPNDNPDFGWQDLQTDGNLQSGSNANAPAAVVSVTELRHSISRRGLKMLKTAQNDARAGKHRKAIEDLLGALNEPSAAPYAESMLGVEYLKTHQPAKAVTQLMEAVRVLPVAANYSNLGFGLCLIGEQRQCQEQLDKAIALDPKAPQPHYVRGVLLLDDGSRTMEAVQELQLAARSAIRSAHLALALYYFRSGDQKTADGELSKYFGPDHPEQLPAGHDWLRQAAAEPRPAVVLGFVGVPK